MFFSLTGGLTTWRNPRVLNPEPSETGQVLSSITFCQWVFSRPENRAYSFPYPTLLAENRTRHQLGALWRMEGRISSVQFSCSVVSDSLQPHGLQHARPPCPSTTPRVYSNSCPLSQWYHPTFSSVVPFSSRLQSFPVSQSFQMSQLFASGGQSIGVSALASVLPMNIQDWFPLGWTGWISLQSKGQDGQTQTDGWKGGPVSADLASAQTGVFFPISIAQLCFAGKYIGELTLILPRWAAAHSFTINLWEVGSPCGSISSFIWNKNRLLQTFQPLGHQFTGFVQPWLGFLSLSSLRAPGLPGYRQLVDTVARLHTACSSSGPFGWSVDLNLFRDTDANLPDTVAKMQAPGANDVPYRVWLSHYSGELPLSLGVIGAHYLYRSLCM